MRSIYNEEIDLVWSNYENLINRLGFYKMLETSDEELQQIFTMKYKDLYYQVKNANIDKGKTKGEVRYSILKLRRLIAVWYNHKVWEMNSGIHYSYRDGHKQFPRFDRQNPDVIPSIKTIHKLQAKVLHQYIEDHNSRVDELRQKGSKDGAKTPRYICNLRDLRTYLIAECKMDTDTATYFTKLYGSVVATKEVNDFSNQTEQFGTPEEIIF